MNCHFDVPALPPVSQPEAMARLQSILLDDVEHWMGPRDRSDACLPPGFRAGPAWAWMTPLGAIAELSPESAQSWQFAVFELAHECVHLANRPLGGASRMEEGAATLYGLPACISIFDGRFLPVLKNGDPYADAMRLVSRMGRQPMAALKAVRREAGNFRYSTPQIVVEAVPGIDHSLAHRLCARFTEALT
ncbi:hypothetical protein HIV01_003470 [Lysobacter arenosi]|uniref:Metallopeptidase domain-containing protein n=1 Tax=Lysobacter arenosi TaxID=2795387 RepID=A0ABX7RDX8_9GAMM|nr:hypothetical protein [Lysobacter arenosi]QSX75604.1 hypothetical protein HIV01_003470 [Lysobacter arenosi]